MGNGIVAKEDIGTKVREDDLQGTTSKLFSFIRTYTPSSTLNKIIAGVIFVEFSIGCLFFTNYEYSMKRNNSRYSPESYMIIKNEKISKLAYQIPFKAGAASSLLFLCLNYRKIRNAIQNPVRYENKNPYEEIYDEDT